MKSFLIFILTLILYSSHSHAFRLGLGVNILSTDITGSNSNTSTDGKLISSSDFLSGFNIGWSISKRFQFLLDYTSGTIEYDNTKSVIAGEESIDFSNTSLGMRFIAHPRVAFRIFANSIQDIAFEVDNNNQAVLYKEQINFISIYYDQILFLGNGMYSGFKLGYDISSDGSKTTDRTGNHMGVFGTIYGFTVEYKVSKITKSNSDLDFEQDDNVLIAKYLLSF